MFTEQLALMQAVEDYFKGPLGYTEVQVHSLSVHTTERFSIYVSHQDDFQEHVGSDQKYRSEGYNSLYFSSIDSLWSALYSWPTRPQRELRVLANQLTGITGMEALLSSVLLKEFLLPILAARDELVKLLPAN